ncbi:MAG: recombinase family protein [Eubacteriales bacterium]|nr:recombinase family protein [Eubacteriales bacterium]
MKKIIHKIKVYPKVEKLYEPLYQKRRVAIYARVSTSSDEQLNSIEAQRDYYLKYVEERSDLIFVRLYADEGITGTSAKKRPQFMAMIEDCRAGKIDVIVTKSVSRFGRNTVDTLSYTRELKTLGIDVYFEKENLHSISPDGELLLTLMAAFAESEAETMSENIAWGFRKRYAEGNTDSLPMHNVYGLDRNTVTGEIFIREDEAPVVRRIYYEFMTGVNTQQISNHLNEDGVPTHRKGAKWHNKTVINILQNEKYCGDVLFQKTFSPGALCRCKQNRGELPQYLLRDAIPAIIDKKQWEITQLEYARRVKQFYGQPSPEHPFTGRIFCGVCGRTVVHSSFKSGGSFKTWWRCSTKVTRMTKLDDIPHDDSRIPLERPAQVFVQSWNLIISKRQQYEPRLKKIADKDGNLLTRYHASEMLRLMDEAGKLAEFDYPLSLRVLDHMELQLDGKLTAVFLSGIRLSI